MMRVPAWALWLEMAIRVAWLVSAAGVGVVMRRLGHDTATWVLVGVVCGPLAVPIAVSAARRAARRPPRVLFPGHPGPGDEDVLVLIDPERPTVAGDRIGSAGAIGRLALAVVIGRTTSDVGARQAEERRAAATLTTARAAVRAATGVDPAGVVLEGRPGHAGPDYARRFGFHRVIGLDAPSDPAPMPAPRGSAVRPPPPGRVRRAAQYGAGTRRHGGPAPRRGCGIDDPATEQRGASSESARG